MAINLPKCSGQMFSVDMKTTFLIVLDVNGMQEWLSSDHWKFKISLNLNFRSSRKHKA